jgi:hypothetical protein
MAALFLRIAITVPLSQKAPCAPWLHGSVVSTRMQNKRLLLTLNLQF